MYEEEREDENKHTNYKYQVSNSAHFIHSSYLNKGLGKPKQTTKVLLTAGPFFWLGGRVARGGLPLLLLYLYSPNTFFWY